MSSPVAPPDDLATHGAAQTDALRMVAPSLWPCLLDDAPGYADLFYSATQRRALTLHRRATPSPFRPTPASPARSHFDEGVGLRVLTRDGGAWTAAPLDPPALLEAAASARRRDDSPRLLPPAAVLPTPPPAPPTPHPVALASIRALLEAAVDTALGADDRIRSVRAVYQDTDRLTALAVSASETVWPNRRILASLRVEVEAAHGGRSALAYALGGGPAGFAGFLFHPPEATALEAVDRALRRLDAGPPPAGPAPVVFTPGWGGAWLHETIGHLLEADLLHTHGAFRDRGGDRIAAPELTLVDDGATASGRASSSYDDEGTPAQRTTLIADGRLCGVLTDLRYAALLERPATGNGRRADFRRPPRPRMTNLLLQPGTASPDDLLAEAEGGLWIEQISGGHLDPDTGRFTLRVADAQRIEGGRPAGPVDPCLLTGDASTLLQGIRGVADDFRLDTRRGMCVKDGEPVPVSVGQPTVLVSGCVVEPAT